MWRKSQYSAKERLKDTWNSYLKYLEEWISENKDEPTWGAPLSFGKWCRKHNKISFETNGVIE